MIHTHDLALLTPMEMARADTAAARSVPSLQLMEHAGRAVARAVLRGERPGGPVLVLCGAGGNGGDGYVAARLLAERGVPVRVAALSPPRPGSDTAQVAARWRGPVVDFAPSEAARAALAIDAVFGAGLSRDLPGTVQRTLAAARRVLAVDVPSGLDGASGEARGAVRQAERTVTFFRAKPGHLLMPGRALCGTLEVADIGLPAGVLDEVGPRCWRNAPGLWRLQPLSASDHKYSRGAVTVIGGPAMTGAARLAAGAARRAGAGLVILSAQEGAAIYRAGDPGLIVEEAPLDDALRDERRKVWVCGPGLPPDAARDALSALVAAGRLVVADAGALAAYAGAPQGLNGAAVITPHFGEFSKLFGKPGPDKLAAARDAAARIGTVIVFKGPDTVVAAPDGRAAINDNAPPWLATAGAGDVLSGIVAALLAEGLPPFEAACGAVWLHGQAAVLAGEGLLAEDLAAHLPEARRRATAGLGA